MHAVPEWNKPPVPVPVQALREFMSRFGADVSVLTTWTHEDPANYQFVTIGSDRLYAEAAVRLRDEISKGMNLSVAGPNNEDLRQDHAKVDLTLGQIDFLLWVLGWMFAEKDRMDDAHRQYIEKYHDQLLPILGDAKERKAKPAKQS